ncbi:MAG: TIGR02710 family CRISPR-associated protein [Candidatus Sericytochromatia bacterium]|nr:TIGR02710 family CRISPR-associated protein [Candidatus Tanganyikabacteria bacterium]
MSTTRSLRPPGPMTGDILVCSAGGSPEPVANAVRVGRPEFVFFLCSKTTSGTEGTDRVVAEKIAPDLECGHEIVALVHPDELEEVYKACRKIERAISRRHKGARVVANYTGGTKTMSLGLGVFALRSGWDLECNVGKRQDIIKITEGDTPMIQGAAAIRADDAWQLASKLVGRHDYEGAVAVADHCLRGLQTRDRQGAGRDLAEGRARWAVLAAWERLDYEEAAKLASLAGMSDETKRLKALLRARKLALGQEAWSMKDRVDGLDLVRDALENARHCAERSRYDDAFARLYRATELLAQVRLRRCHAAGTGDVKPDELPLADGDRQWLEGLRNPRSRRVEIGLWAAFMLLEKLGDPVGDYFMANEEALHGFVSVRNSSLLAHGLTPVSGKHWKDQGQAWDAWLTRALALAE